MPASKKTATHLCNLVEGYRLCAATEGKSQRTIQAVVERVGYLERWLCTEGLAADVREIGPVEIRAFILYLQQKRRFSFHPFAKPQQGGLSKHTVNSYLRSIRAFWSWIVAEGIVPASPFTRVKIPKAPTKVIPTFSDHQLEALLSVIDMSTAEGFRDYAIILTLLDTGLRVSELTGLKLENVWLDEGLLKVVGKGGKERLVPIGKVVQRLLWRYTNRLRPHPALPGSDLLFLTADGRPMSP